MLVRRQRRGCFEHFLARADAEPLRRFSIEDFSIASSTGAHYGEARVAPFTKANTSSASILTDTAAKKFARS